MATRKAASHSRSASGHRAFIALGDDVELGAVIAPQDRPADLDEAARQTNNACGVVTSAATFPDFSHETRLIAAAEPAQSA